jgi:hypothetical protein
MSGDRLQIQESYLLLLAFARTAGDAYTFGWWRLGLHEPGVGSQNVNMC